MHEFRLDGAPGVVPNYVRRLHTPSVFFSLHQRFPFFHALPVLGALKLYYFLDSSSKIEIGVLRAAVCMTR